MPKTLKVLLVEDDWSVRQAVRDYLLKRGMAVWEANCLEATLDVAETVVPDVAVIDIVLPTCEGERADFDRHVGIEVARRLRERFPHMGIVFLSAYVDRGPEVVQLFMEGHDRIVYLLKGSKPQALLDAIYKVAGGLSALEIAAGVMTVQRTVVDRLLAVLTEEERVCIERALADVETLSAPELEVFEAVGSCRTRRLAAQELEVSTKTIGSHMDAIYSKLHLRQAHRALISWRCWRKSIWPIIFRRALMT